MGGPALARGRKMGREEEEEEEGMLLCGKEKGRE